MRITKRRKIVVTVIALFLIFVTVGILTLYVAVHKVKFDIEVVRAITFYALESEFEIGIKIINPTIFPIRVSSDFRIFVEDDFGAFGSFEGIDVGPKSDRVVLISAEFDHEVMPRIRYAWAEFGSLHMKIDGWAYYHITNVQIEVERTVEVEIQP